MVLSEFSLIFQLNELVHDGIVWGLVTIFGERLKCGDVPHSHTLLVSRELERRLQERLNEVLVGMKVLQK